MSLTSLLASSWRAAIPARNPDRSNCSAPKGGLLLRRSRYSVPSRETVRTLSSVAPDGGGMSAGSTPVIVTESLATGVVGGGWSPPTAYAPQAKQINRPIIERHFMARLQFWKRVLLIENCFLDAPRFRENCFCPEVMGCDIATARTLGTHRYRSSYRFPSVLPDERCSPQGSDRS